MTKTQAETHALLVHLPKALHAQLQEQSDQTQIPVATLVTSYMATGMLHASHTGQASLYSGRLAGNLVGAASPSVPSIRTFTPLSLSLGKPGREKGRKS